MYNDVIYLISAENTMEIDEYGDKVTREKLVMRFAKLKSVSQSEFYQAQTVGVKPEIKVELADYLDYEDQQEVIYNSIRYKVLRTYRTATNSIELTLYGGVRNANAAVSDENN